MGLVRRIVRKLLPYLQMTGFIMYISRDCISWPSWALDHFDQQCWC